MRGRKWWERFAGSWLAQGNAEMTKALVLGLLTASLLQGQGNRASITGTVTDPSKAAAPKIEVTAINIATQDVTRATTNNDGIYTILNLFPGKYSLRFNGKGFKPVEITGITLESTQVAKFDQEIAVGSVSESLTVTADAPVLDSETVAIGTNLSAQVVTDLPLNIYGGRQIESFAVALTPGYSPFSSPYAAVINGTQGFTKDFTVDGTSATAQIQGDSMEIGPTMEAIQEVQAQTSGIDAANAITNGGVMMFNLKSGSNQIHASAFGSGHNELLDARVWGNPDKPKSRFWNYGGSVGGPVRKNKTFYFGAFERYQQNDFSLGSLGNGTGAATVPTPAFLNGDFSALLNTSVVLGQDVHGNAIHPGAIFNPQDAGAVFAGNVIPSNLISSVSKKIVALYQKDYSPQSTSLVGNNRFPTSNSPSQTPNQAVIKLDHNLTERNHLSGSWVYDHRPRLLVDSGGVWQSGSTDGGPMASDRFQTVVGHQFRAGDSLTITPNLLNIFTATYNRYWNGSVPASSGTNWLQELGLDHTTAVNFPAIGFGGAVNGVGETGLGNTWQGYYVASTFLLDDNLSWTHGKHIFKFGGNFRAMEINSHGGSGADSFNFSNNVTGAPSQAYANQVGFGFASFLLGNVQTATQTTPYDLYGRRKAMSLFAQDSWKVTPKLTLNIGLRWDATFRFHEKYGHWANFDLNTVDPNLGIPGAVLYPKNGSDSFEKNQDWHNFGPQIGIAYNPWKKVVFRGSFGILYVPIGIQYFNGVPYGFAPGFHGTNAASAPFNWDNGYPGVFSLGTKSSTLPINQLAVNIDPNALRAGYSNNINLGVQYELTKSMKLEVSYVGNRGHHLQDSGLANNQASPSTFFNLIKSGNGFNYVCDPGTAASYGVPYPYAGFCAPAVAAIAPYPQLAAAATTYWFYPTLFYVGLPIGQSYYDSTVFHVTKRASIGMNLDFSYTLSRQQGDTFNNFGESYDTAGIQDFNNLTEAAHTLTPYDQKHVVKGAVTYELPFGHGHRLLSNQGEFMNKLVSGWRVSGLVLYASGAPLNFYSSNYYFYPAWAATYANYNLAGYGGSKFSGGNFQQPSASNATPAGNLYFPATVASNPAYGEFGTGPVRIDAVRGFGIKSENVSLLKNTYFGAEKKYKLQFRVEFYNIFNRHSFVNPDTNLSSPTFGYVTGVSSSPRQGQFGARFEW